MRMHFYLIAFPSSWRFTIKCVFMHKIDPQKIAVCVGEIYSVNVQNKLYIL